MTSRSRKSLLLIVLTVVALSLQTGCYLPLAVWVAPEVGSGMELRFCEEDGNLIEKDGLLIVHRKYWVVPYVDGAPSNHVVKITRGHARIPQEWAIGSCWISPFHGGILPGYNLSIIPLIPEYAAEEYEASPIPWLQPNHFDADGDGTIIVVKRPGSGWESCQRALRRRFEKAGPYARLDLRLSDVDYFRVKRFIQAELRRQELEKGRLAE